MIMIFLIVCSTQLIKYNKIEQGIKDNCGYERSDKVFCVCDKNVVSLIPISNNPYYQGEEELTLTPWD